MKKLCLSTLFMLLAICSWAQNGTGITGKVVDSKTQKPVKDVVATIVNTNLSQVTDAQGVFKFMDIAAGDLVVRVKTQGYKEQLLQLKVEAGKLLDLGVIVADEDITEEQQLSLITLTENDLGDDNSGSETTAGLLQASRDAFQQAAAFNWGQARFRIRGLDNEYGTTMINGLIMNKIYDGRPQWSNWGGLNDATRNQEFTTGTAPSDYTFGNILGTQEINTRASAYRPGSRISYSETNTNYSHRVMGTHASGMDTNGWAYVVSGSWRWAEEGYFEGTTYDSPSLFASVEKKLSDKHALNFTAIYARNERGKNSPNTAEVTAIAGEKYNSYWGYQAGEKRNSRKKLVEEPILMLNHYWRINDRTNVNTGVSYQAGQIGNSRLAYQGVDNPDPTYYRNLPSYYTSQFDADDYSLYIGNTPANLTLAASSPFLTNRQINWDALYEANRSTHDGHSVYALYEDRTDDKLITANSVLNSQLADNISMNAGVTFRNLRSHNFENLLDLLGGQYYTDYDNFQSGSQQVSDLNAPYRKVVEGDHLGYNYNLLSNVIDAFTQFKFTYRKIDFYMAQSFTRTDYQREGLYRNGLYPSNSFGKSDRYTFENFGFKGGFTYKISGRHFINANAYYATEAPSLRNVFPNVRLNNEVSSDLSSQNVTSFDASYIIRAPKLKARLTAYASNMKNATRTSFFFSEGIFDDASGADAFISETLTNIEMRNIGAELGLEYQVTSTIKLTAAGGYGEYTYNNNPRVFVNNDNLASETNNNPLVDFGRANLKGYRMSGGPQTAASFGVEYRDPHFWWIGANANYLANNYIDVSALLRTSNFFNDPLNTSGAPITFPEATPERVNQLLAQEKFDDVYLVNLTGGKSWKVKNNTFGFFASVNNVFDEIYKTGGFEQSRKGNFRELNQDQSSGHPSFGPKYFYGYGRTYFVNLYYNF